jgi:hypothetical protein
VADWIPSEAGRNSAISDWQQQTFAPAFTISAVENTDYYDTLAAYHTWHTPGLPVAMRCAALAYASRGLDALCARAPTIERLSTFARVAWEWGARAKSVTALQQLFQALQGTTPHIREPFWPASSRFDDVPPGPRPDEWLAGSVVDQYERTASFSSAFSHESPFLAWLCTQPFASAEMERRRVLLAARAGQQPRVPPRLSQMAPDHLNADIWCAGRVPGTTVGP